MNTKHVVDSRLHLFYIEHNNCHSVKPNSSIKAHRIILLLKSKSPHFCAKLTWSQFHYALCRIPVSTVFGDTHEIIWLKPGDTTRLSDSSFNYFPQDIRLLSAFCQPMSFFNDRRRTPTVKTRPLHWAYQVKKIAL